MCSSLGRTFAHRKACVATALGLRRLIGIAATIGLASILGYSSSGCVSPEASPPTPEPISPSPDPNDPSGEDIDGGVEPAPQSPDAALPIASWRLIWSDEFSGTTIDLDKWSYEVNCWGGGNNEQQCYTARPENSYVRDGLLQLKAQREDFTGPTESEDSPAYDPDTTRTLPYTSARLRSREKGDFRYGRVEVRAKLPAGQGTWPAIWMLPTDSIYGTWAASGEIDIMEAVNLKAESDAPNTPAGTPESRIHGTLHYGSSWPQNVYSGTEYRLPASANPADAFHTYAIEWEQGEIRWYVNDVHYATQTQDGWYARYRLPDGRFVLGPNDAPFDQRFHLLLNLAVGGNWAGNVNETGIDESVFPQTLSIDYVRVYECSADPTSGRGCANINPNAEHVRGNSPPG